MLQLLILPTPTSTGIGQLFQGTVDKKTGVSSGTGVVGLGFINGTDFVLIHSAIPTDATYFVNYTNNPASQIDAIGQFGQIHATNKWCCITGNGAGGVVLKVVKLQVSNI